jgi:steroid 5-alpha reductase family enzyme
MSALELLTVAAAAVVAGALALWVVSLRRRDASLVDRFWGPGFVLVAALGAVAGAGPLARKVLVFVLVAIWGLRLGWHIHRRNRGQGEDPRYVAMRAHHGEAFGRVSLFTVFLLQAAILLVVALPLVAAASATEPATLGALDLLATLVWLGGFLFEAVGDTQLARFKADPANRGRVMDRGLWRYTRHPNYFGDATLWWGLFLFAAATGAWWTAVGPALMTLLLVRVSGVVLLEKGLAASKPGYAAYVARTSAFLPRPPRAAR